MPKLTTLTALLLVAGIACGRGQAAPAPSRVADLPDTPSVRILSVFVSGEKYLVYFDENVFDNEDLMSVDPEYDVGEHVHFYFDKVDEVRAGLPGAGPWYGYVGNSPLRHYFLRDRPKGATRLCAVIANPDHSARAGTGNCVDLPDAAQRMKS